MVIGVFFVYIIDGTRHRLFKEMFDYTLPMFYIQFCQQYNTSVVNEVLTSGLSLIGFWLTIFVWGGVFIQGIVRSLRSLGLNSSADLVVYVSAFLGLFVFFLYSYMGSYEFQNSITLFLVTVCFTIILPINFIAISGYYVLSVVKGAGPKSLIVGEFFTDFLNIISFFLRIGVQWIRVTIVIVTLFMANELVIGYDVWGFMEASLGTSFLTAARLGLEVLHTFILIAVQGIAFFAMLLGLFQLLFTVFTK